jgi:hypothetical protein
VGGSRVKVSEAPALLPRVLCQATESRSPSPSASAPAEISNRLISLVLEPCCKASIASDAAIGLLTLSEIGSKTGKWRSRTLRLRSASIRIIPRLHYSEVFVSYALTMTGSCFLVVSGRLDDHSAIDSRIASMFHKMGAVGVGLIRNQWTPPWRRS